MKRAGVAAPAGQAEGVMEMPDAPILPHTTPDAAEILRQIASSQARMALNLRELNAILGTPDCDAYDCEICGSPVPASDRSGFAARHGSTCHSQCFDTQYNASR
jgi:hypothetical protein